jgi:eukaryotic-like serine/threonine-protein kinase
MEEPRRLGGRYEIGPVLGRGGMAEVHTARDTRLGRTVAVKMLRVDLARDPTFQARFRREAQSAASLNHSSIVAVYDTGEDVINGVSLPYIVMEYVDGSTLRDLIQSGRRLLPERALEITAGVLQALAYSHRNGIIHRDIKPGNVMLTRGGQVKVMDFGIARAMADTSATMTQTAAVIGTAQYLSPEQAKGEPVDARSDLYSAGCLVYELLTGRPPFVGDSPVSVAYQHVREDPVPPSHLDPELSPDIDRIVLTSLAKDPGHRYQDADEMRADIERAIEGRPVAAPAYVPDATQRIAPAAAAATTSVYDPVPPGRGPEPEGNRKAGYALLALAVVAIFVGALYIGREFWNTGSSGEQKVNMPNVVGQRAEVAVADLKRDGFTSVQTETVVSNAQDKGEVFDQEPNATTPVAKSDPVILKIAQPPQQESPQPTSEAPSPQPTSEAPKAQVMPNLIGQRERDARRELNRRGLAAEFRPEVSDQEKGRVVRTDPEPNQPINPDRKIIVFVSTGRGDQQQDQEVPPVVGLSRQAAELSLLQRGFRVEVEEDDKPPNGARENVVFDQNPDAGERRKPGSTVKIKVPAQGSTGGGGNNLFNPLPGAQGPGNGQSPGSGRGRGGE